MGISFRQIEFFLAVAETLSFSRASSICHISQPALSMNIRKLEEALGARLFDRHTRNVSLTAVGVEFYGLAQTLTENMAQARDTIHAFIEGKRGSLVIAAGPSIATHFTPQAIGRFLKQFPNIRVRLHDELSDDCVAMLRSGKADVALIPSQDETDDLLQSVLFRDHLAVVCPRDHGLTKFDAVQWRDVCKFPQIAVSSHSSLRRIVDAQLSRFVHPFAPAYEVAQVGTMLGLIDAGLGIGVLSESLLERIDTRRLAYRRIMGRSAYRNICAVRLRRRSPVPSLQSFLDVCCALVSERPEYQA